MRQFEFPYNFDKQLIVMLKEFDPYGFTIKCIYLPPFQDDYKTILRGPTAKQILDNMTRDEYEQHLSFINNFYPNKMQLILQKPNLILSEEKIKYYISLGINSFCVASIEQAKIIKNLDSNIEIIGSIVMQINKEKIEQNLDEYQKYFDGFVLPFKFAKKLQELKLLPSQFFYIILANTYCNYQCPGIHHWNATYEGDIKIKCPGLLRSVDKTRNIPWEKSARIRPMDLGFFDPYIQAYKLQDRGWPTSEIIREYILYTTHFSIYPNIIYDESIYCL